MSRVWFASSLETVATFWRVERSDGVALGFTTHDRALFFDGLMHRSAPGMTPSAIRKTIGFEPDSAEVQGALDHAAITAEDLGMGRYDGARVAIGLVDWESLETFTIFSGSLGEVQSDGDAFSAELRSRKAELLVDRIPRTSPTCRAEFCGAKCGLPSARFSHRATIVSYETDTASILIDAPVAPSRLVGGSLRWRDGDLAGRATSIVGSSGDALILADHLPGDIAVGDRVSVREGCDRLMATCNGRFGNARNFRGEPTLPGNDLIARYPAAR